MPASKCTLKICINFFKINFDELILNNFKENSFMRNKTVTLCVVFLSLFSLAGFSQAPEKSNHPLLDKYYPRQQADTSANSVTETNPTPQFNPTTVKPVPRGETKRAPLVKDTKAIKSTTTALPAAEIKTDPGPDPVTVNTSVPVTNVSKPLGDTTAISKPVTTMVPASAPQKVQPQRPPSKPYMDTRLGSSSPLYDTYEKNSNGAGSVTTSPK